jgi:hypothetical protein
VHRISRRDLWPQSHLPFAGAFGNKSTDAEAYRKVGVPLSRIYIVDSRGKLTGPDGAAAEGGGSYGELRRRVSDLFPHPQPSVEALEQLAPHTAAVQFGPPQGSLAPDGSTAEAMGAVRPAGPSETVRRESEPNGAAEGVEEIS